MKADKRFEHQSNEFWANIRTISQEIGYTDRKTSNILIPEIKAIIAKYKELDLNYVHICNNNGKLTNFGELIIEYFAYRANELNKVAHLLMTKDEAAHEFHKIKERLHKNVLIPLNKQKGEKKNYAYLTGIVNIIIESEIGDIHCDYDPRRLTTITKERMPFRTLSRRVDGAFPSVINPIAIWEIKEYYYTTTFGSRVADGVYETLLDGMELEELERTALQKVQHVLIIDDHFTWWKCGRSYLCRIFDMLHMGYVDEVVFGREVFTRLPELVREWVQKYQTMV